MASAVGVRYIKRFRMEIDLAGRRFGDCTVPATYRTVPWHPDLLEVHAETKFLSFRSEIDSEVFPCLGELTGCLGLMDEIRRKDGFLPEATWLVQYIGQGSDGCEFCGTVQGIRTESGYGGIQNLGVIPQHRGRGLGRILMVRALCGFQRAGLGKAFLEVTARNRAAVELYERMGFSRIRTMYKAVEAAHVR